jgi:hypothetical protein
VSRAPLAALAAAAVLAAAGCAATPQPVLPQQPYKVVLLPVEGAEQALAAKAETTEDGGRIVPLALTAAELGDAIFQGVRQARAFTEMVEAPQSARVAGDAYAGDELAAAADFARRSNADLILRITVKSARIRDLGRNDSTAWATITWLLLGVPSFYVDDRTYDANVTVEAALYEPRDTVKPTASVVAASGRMDLDLIDRGVSPWVIIMPPPFIEGDDRTVGLEVTQRAMRQVMEALSNELRTRPIPTRFDLEVRGVAGGVEVVAASRRQLRSIDVYVGGKLAASWAETALVPEKDSTDDRRVYRRTVKVAPRTGEPAEVRVVAEDEAGGREVRTVVPGRGE